jgi:large subunit ribosomal protein L19e
MNLKTQKRIAAQVLKVGVNRVKFDDNKLSDIKDAITKTDIRSLIKGGIISKKPLLSQSRVRARKIKEQKKKGNRKGPGSKKGSKNARLNRKTIWVRKIRILRKFLRELKTKKLINTKNYRLLILRSKGGLFRSKRHLKLYLNERKLIEENKNG